MKHAIWVLLCLVLSVVVLTGCATTVKTSETITGDLKEHILPEIGEITKAFLGDPLGTEWKTRTDDMIVLTSRFGIIRVTAHHPKGNYILIGKQEDLLVYQHEGTYFDGWAKRKSQVLETPDGTVYRKTYSGTKEVPKEKYEKTHRITDVSDSLNQTFLFTGSEGTMLTFTYHEFLANRSRQSFSTEATYDISKSTLVRFKDLALEVLAYDNQSITYRLLSGFKY